MNDPLDAILSALSFVLMGCSLTFIFLAIVK